MLMKLYMALILVVAVSFYSFFSMIRSIELETDEVAQAVQNEVKEQSTNYLREKIRKRVNPSFGSSRSGRAASSALPIKQLAPAATEATNASAKDIIEDQDGLPTLSVEDAPELDEQEPTLDPEENPSPFTQHQLDRYIERLETIQNTPSEYLRKTMLVRFKKEMEDELKLNAGNTSAQWLLHEIAAELEYLKSQSPHP